jgi:hypothetical protein
MYHELYKLYRTLRRAAARETRFHMQQFLYTLAFDVLDKANKVYPN